MLTCSKLISTAVAISVVFLLTAWAAAADTMVVANSRVTDSSLSGDQIKAIFLGQMTSWPSGAKVEFVTLKDSSEIHEDFLKKYVGRSSAQFSNYWKQQVFTGKGRMPKQFESETKLLEYVSATDGALGYIAAGTAKGAAKTISVK